MMRCVRCGSYYNYYGLTIFCPPCGQEMKPKPLFEPDTNVQGSDGRGCLALGVIALVVGVLYEIYDWFSRNHETIILYSFIVALLALFVFVSRKIGFVPALMVALLTGGAYGIYTLYTQYVEEARQEAERIAHEEKMAAEAAINAKVDDVKQAEKEQQTTALDAYFSQGILLESPPAEFIDVHPSYSSSELRKKQKAVSLIVSSDRIEGLATQPITDVKFRKREGFYAFDGISEGQRCYGNVEHLPSQLVFSSICMEGKDRVATNLRYIPVKSNKLRRSLKALFKTTNQGALQGYWHSSDAACSKAKGYSFLGRGMMLTQTGNQIAVFNDIGEEKVSGLATIDQKYGRCDGTIESAGKTKQVRLTCAWSEVDREQPNRDTYEARVAQGEHVFALCRQSSRFP